MYNQNTFSIKPFTHYKKMIFNHYAFRTQVISVDSVKVCDFLQKERAFAP